ncbi:phage tail protein [Escherichia coli]|uniref:phage tail protein n=3 Tax=Escherichia coli TaxID=562 RepID=UPI000BE505B4|nr:phage tail protein [Escherichia coli]MBL7655596.1 tail fiber protein [Escherichia coli]MCH6620160.1 integrase [Escherichia coli]MCH6920015.1 integrase [Escherichia coli]MDY8177361.1 phage tail protein [Escherichia coli]QSC69537.1 tail fiber protein [Escherichia coli]
MLRIGQVEATATQDGKYTDGSVAGGIAATRLRAAAFNAMQEELAHIVESAGLALDINDMTQVLKAIQKLTLSRANPFADIKSDGAAAISTALTNLGLGEGSALPVGVPVPWPSATPPTGWLKCNGAAFSAEEYPELAKAYPTNKLPDLRGEFIRGWDDGRGMDTGRAILSAQGDAIRNIYGEFKTVNTENYSIWESVGSFKGAVVPLNPSTNNSYFSLIRSMVTERTDGAVYPKVIGLDASRIVPTANENRPRNIAFNYIVRAA